MQKMIENYCPFEASGENLPKFFEVIVPSKLNRKLDAIYMQPEKDVDLIVFTILYKEEFFGVIILRLNVHVESDLVKFDYFISILIIIKGFHQVFMIRIILPFDLIFLNQNMIKFDPKDQIRIQIFILE